MEPVSPSTVRSSPSVAGQPVVGFGRGARVVTRSTADVSQLERSLEQVAAILGVLRSGGAYVPLDPKWPLERRRFVAVDAGCARCGARYLLPDGTPLGSTRCSGCGAMGLEGVTHGAIGETEPGRCPSCSAQLRAPAITAEHGPRYHVRCPACGQAVRPIPSAQPAPE